MDPAAAESTPDMTPPRDATCASMDATVASNATPAAAPTPSAAFTTATTAASKEDFALATSESAAVANSSTAATAEDAPPAAACMAPAASLSTTWDPSMRIASDSTLARVSARAAPTPEPRLPSSVESNALVCSSRVAWSCATTLDTSADWPVRCCITACSSDDLAASRPEPTPFAASIAAARSASTAVACASRLPTCEVSAAVSSHSLALCDVSAVDAADAASFAAAAPCCAARA